MKPSTTADLQRRLRGLAAFLPVFGAPGFSFGSWNQAKSTEPGVSFMPTFSFSTEVYDFIRTAYELGWVRIDFDWSEWTESPEATTLRDDAEALAAATPDQLERLLTVLIRQDRFCEGSLASDYESGLITRILRRAAVLAAELAGTTSHG